MQLERLMEECKKFRDERDWEQFHTPKNLAISISLEASELLELFQWAEPEEYGRILKERKSDISDEVADILIYLMLFADGTGVNLEEAVIRKLEKNKIKYPAEKYRGVYKA